MNRNTFNTIIARGIEDGVSQESIRYDCFMAYYKSIENTKPDYNITSFFHPVPRTKDLEKFFSYIGIYDEVQAMWEEQWLKQSKRLKVCAINRDMAFTVLKKRLTDEGFSVNFNASRYSAKVEVYITSDFKVTFSIRYKDAREQIEPLLHNVLLFKEIKQSNCPVLSIKQYKSI